MTLSAQCHAALDSCWTVIWRTQVHRNGTALVPGALSVRWVAYLSTFRWCHSVRFRKQKPNSGSGNDIPEISPADQKNNQPKMWWRLVCYKICYDIVFFVAGDITAVWSHTRKYCSIVSFYSRMWSSISILVPKKWCIEFSLPEKVSALSFY